MANPYLWRAPAELADDWRQLQLRKDQLDAMLRKRRGKPGFAANTIAIEAEIAKVDEEIANGSNGAETP